MPPAEDTLVFFDPSLLFTRMGGMFKMMAGSPAAKVGEKADGDESSQGNAEGNPVAAIGKILEDVSIMDYIATVEYTDGYRVFSESVAKLKVDAKNKPLYEILSGGKGPDDFAQFIPKEAEEFNLSSGINFKALFAYIRKFVETQIPGGKDGIAEFDRIQKENWGIDLENDVFGVLEGPMISFSMGRDWLIMFKVSNEKKIGKVISDLLKKANEALGENALTLTPVKIGDDLKFTQLSHPMMMMMGGMTPPVWGCAKGYLIIGSSGQTVERCLDTASGKHPNITKNKRWEAEAIRPQSGKVDSISFTDESNFAAGLQQAIGGVSMGLGMAGMMGLSQAPPNVRTLIQAIPGLLAKLGPVAGKLDFYRSSSEMTTFDGHRWVTKKVQNYKDPATRAKSKPAESEEVKPVAKKPARKKHVEAQAQRGGRRQGRRRVRFHPGDLMSTSSTLVTAEHFRYIAERTAQEDDFLRDLKRDAAAAGIPEISICPEQAAFMQILLRLAKAKDVVEIGTLAGYSAISMARALPEDGRLRTIEFNPKHADFAESRFKRSDVAGRIELFRGAGMDVLPRFATDSADAAFLDADKASYGAYLKECLRIVRRGGLILVDNAFAFGQLFDEEPTDREAPAVREFNEIMAREKRLASVIVPLGDGLWVGIKL